MYAYTDVPALTKNKICKFWNKHSSTFLYRTSYLPFHIYEICTDE